jgi:hypothetical protein
MSFRLSSKEVIAFGAPILTVGMAGLTLISNKTFLETRLGHDLSFLDNHWAFTAAMISVGLGGVIVLGWLVANVAHNLLFGLPKSVQEKSERLKELLGRLDDLSLRPCDVKDMEIISKLAQEQFGSMAATLDRNLWLSTLDDQAYNKVVDSRGRIVGFYDIFRLSSLGRKAAERDEFDITNCPREYLRGDKKRYTDLYLAGLYGRDIRSKAMVLGAVNEKVIAHRPNVVFARAGTEQGLRLLERRGFRPVVAGRRGLGALYVLKVR